MPLVQNPEQFLEDFIHTAQKAEKRIYLQSMVFERGNFLSKLEPVLLQKARAGLDVRVTIDWVYQRYVGDNPNLIPTLDHKFRKHGEKVHQETNDLIRRWENAGIRFTITNTPTPFASIISIAGRNHIKMYLIDETAAWMGGVNLFDNALGLIDFLVKFTDPTIIKALATQYNNVNEHKPKENYRKQCNENNTLLVDAGIKGKSIIFNEAIQLIHYAKKKIIFASQFLPDSKLLQALFTVAKQGVTVIIITSSRETKTFNRLPYNVPYLYLTKKIAKMDRIKLIHRERRVHAKLLLVDEAIALFGSHNMTTIGVQLGTEEIAMKTTDKNLVGELEQFITNNPSPKR